MVETQHPAEPLDAFDCADCQHSTAIPRGPSSAIPPENRFGRVVGHHELFNVVEDPGEAKDLSKSMPDKLDTLKAQWDHYADEVGVVPAEQ